MLKKKLALVLGEPIVQFAVIGTMLYALSDWLGSSGSGNRIELNPAMVAHLESSFIETWDRPPTASERARLVDDFIREEIAYREAISLGLHRDDVIIRRRLRQKLEFLAEDTSTAAAPSDAQLSALLSHNLEAYRSESMIALRQVYFAAPADALDPSDWQNLLARLQMSGAKAPIHGMGDPSGLPQAWALGPVTDLRKTFGVQFVEAVLGLEPRKWHGPISSGIGSHLVYVEEITPGILPEVAQIRSLLEHDYLLKQRERQLDEMYTRLREKYPVDDATGAEPVR